MESYGIFNNKRFACFLLSLVMFLFLMILQYDVWLYESQEVQIVTLAKIVVIIYISNYSMLYAPIVREKIMNWFDESDYFFYEKD